MTPLFLPHTALDASGELLPPPLAHGRAHLLALRDRALAEGAQVLLLLWPDLHWAMLAVEPPADVQVEDAQQLVPNILANPDVLHTMHENAKHGQHLSWLCLVRPRDTRH